MQVGDLYAVDLSSTATISFSGAGSSAQYVLLVQSTAESAGTALASVTNEAVLSAGLSKNLARLDGTLAAEDLADSLDIEAEFDRFLRDEETRLPMPAAAAAPSVGKSLRKSVTVGTERSFRVLSSLYSTSAYTTVTATVQCVNDAVAVYLDNATESQLSAEQMATLCSQFQTSLQTEYDLLGDPPDSNGDGVVTVLMTKVVNELGGSAGGIVTGFFFAGDLFDQSSVSASNEQEIIFTMVPDPSGQYGTAIPVDFALSNLLPAVVPHEVQHLLSYHYHVQVNGGSTESAWLNEGMAHLIEDLVGYGQENPSREELYLAQPYSAALIPSGSPGLTERGASYLFLRYLYEQVSDGNALARALLQTDNTGVNNILAAVGSSDSSLDSWDEMLQRWGIAVALTNTGITSDSRYIYADRTLDSVTGQWHGVCVQCTPDDGRGTVLSGVGTLSAGTSVNIRASAGAYYSIPTPPAQLTITPASGASLQGVLMRVE